jgi:hypothetical protein
MKQISPHFIFSCKHCLQQWREIRDLQNYMIQLGNKTEKSNHSVAGSLTNSGEVQMV